MPTAHRPTSPLREPGRSDADESMLTALLRSCIEAGGGWMRFDDFMRAALYEPGLGYYSGGARKFGRAAGDGSDFVTAPELSPLFGEALAAQVLQVMQLSEPSVLEFGAGSGRLAAHLLASLGDACGAYSIVELSGTLRDVQRATLQRLVPDSLHKVRWLDSLPSSFAGCMLGNEVLDAMPVRLIERGERRWLERGVVWHDNEFASATIDAEDSLVATIESRLDGLDGHGSLPIGYRTEIAEEASGFITTLGDVLNRGAAIFIDYGFPQAEYFHPQRSGGTLMCHEGHLSDTDPLVRVGRKDITAHVDFTAIALAGQNAALDVAGYTSQARFLMNCGVVGLLEAADFEARNSARMLIVEHEMGELFKAIAFTKNIDPIASPLIGFVEGDRMHTL